MLSCREGKGRLSSGEAIAELSADGPARHDGGMGGPHGGLWSSMEMKGQRSRAVHDSIEKKQGGDVHGALELRVRHSGARHGDMVVG